MKRFLRTLVLSFGVVMTAVAAENTCCVSTVKAGAALPDKSLYQVTSLWTNDVGRSLEFASLRGKPQIVTMFFANCEFACPLLVNDMKRIEQTLPENVRTNVGFVLISFDIERDTPGALAQFRQKHSLGKNWTLLRGSSDDVLEIAALLGVKYRKDGRGQFAHSNLITLLNQEGEVVARQNGLNQPGAELARIAERLITGKELQN